MLLGGCAPTHIPPIDFTGARVIMLCIINCPLAVNVADEGEIVDALPIEQTHLMPENVRAITERPQ